MFQKDKDVRNMCVLLHFFFYIFLSKKGLVCWLLTCRILFWCHTHAQIVMQTRHCRVFALTDAIAIADTDTVASGLCGHCHHHPRNWDCGAHAHKQTAQTAVVVRPLLRMLHLLLLLLLMLIVMLRM